jgi:hypothetical protein
LYAYQFIGDSSWAFGRELQTELFFSCRVIVAISEQISQ